MSLIVSWFAESMHSARDILQREVEGQRTPGICKFAFGVWRSASYVQVDSCLGYICKLTEDGIRSYPGYIPAISSKSKSKSGGFNWMGPGYEPV